jgi:hypothetical protein
MNSCNFRMFCQRHSRVLTKRVSHAFDKPRWLEQKMQDSEPLGLEVVNQLVPDVVRFPGTRPDYRPEFADRDRGTVRSDCLTLLSVIRLGRRG